MKITKALIVLACMPLVATASASVFAAERMKSGMWEVTTTEDGKSRANTHCLTPDQVKGSNGTDQEMRAALNKSAAGLHCTIQEFVLHGDVISYAYVCPDRSTTYSTTYHGDAYESVVTAKGAAGSHTLQVKGRRLSDCP
jgi:hypothetical protein